MDFMLYKHADTFNGYNEWIHFLSEVKVSKIHNI
jgi:hypothetical protein